MRYFNAPDWTIIFCYLAAFWTGIWFGKDQRNTRDYFLGSKNVAWWAIGVSIVAAETSALTIIGVPAMAFGAALRLCKWSSDTSWRGSFWRSSWSPITCAGDLLALSTPCQRLRPKRAAVGGGFFSSAKRSRPECVYMWRAYRSN